MCNPPVFFKQGEKMNKEPQVQTGRAAVSLVRYALALGYSVSVVSEGETDLEKSQILQDVKSAMYACDEMGLKFYDQSGKFVGFAVVVGDNNFDEEVADHSDNREWMNDWSEGYDRLVYQYKYG